MDAIEYLASNMVDELRWYSQDIMVVGSIRRKKVPNDIDIVLIPKDFTSIKNDIREVISKFNGHIISSGDKQIYFKCKQIDVNIYFSAENNWGAQILTRTGSKGYNIYLRKQAKILGLKLNQYGLWDGDKLLASKTEEEIFNSLGIIYKVPELR